MMFSLQLRIQFSIVNLKFFKCVYCPLHFNRDSSSQNLYAMILDAAGRLLALVSRNPPLKTWKMLLLFVTELACQKKRHRHTFGQKFEFCSKTLIYKLNSNDVHKVYNFQWNSYLVYALDIFYIILNSKIWNYFWTYF